MALKHTVQSKQELDKNRLTQTSNGKLVRKKKITNHSNKKNLSALKSQ